MTRELVAEYAALVATAPDEETINALVDQVRGDRRLTEIGRAKVYDALVERLQEVQRAGRETRRGITARPPPAAPSLSVGTQPGAAASPAGSSFLPAAPAPSSVGLVLPIATPAQARAAWDAYVAMAQALEDPADVVEIEGRRFRRKSFWRKIALAYGVDVEQLGEERRLEPQPSGEVRIAFYVRVRALAKSGRHFDGVGSCSSLERKGERKEHDIYATAFTRAANRAIADLVAAGEVSAEEVE